MCDPCISIHFSIQCRNVLQVRQNVFINLLYRRAGHIVVFSSGFGSKTQRNRFCIGIHRIRSRIQIIQIVVCQSPDKLSFLHIAVIILTGNFPGTFKRLKESIYFINGQISVCPSVGILGIRNAYIHVVGIEQSHQVVRDINNIISPVVKHQIGLTSHQGLSPRVLDCSIQAVQSCLDSGRTCENIVLVYI